jgi:hypothetical protein
MVYKTGVVACIKVGGKILREDKTHVTIPFGSEYSVLIKNMESRRIQVKVSVDGKDATEGTWLIVQPNSSLELERYIRNGNLDKENKFKFIERTDQIEQNRGIKVEDGLVRIEYKKEKETVEVPLTRYKYYDHYVPVPRPYPRPYWGDYVPVPRPYPRPYTYPYTYPTITCHNADFNSNFNNSNVFGSTVTTAGINSGLQSQSSVNFSSSNNSGGNFLGNVNSVNTSSVLKTAGGRQKLAASLPRGSSTRSLGIMMKSATVSASASNSSPKFMSFTSMDNDAGITVPGSESNQKFTYGSWFATEDHSDVIVISLRGTVGSKPVVQAVTVDRKPKCETCGKKNKGNAKFCSQCGTALELI